MTKGVAYFSSPAAPPASQALTVADGVAPSAPEWQRTVTKRKFWPIGAESTEVSHSEEVAIYDDWVQKNSVALTRTWDARFDVVLTGIMAPFEASWRAAVHYEAHTPENQSLADKAMVRVKGSVECLRASYQASAKTLAPRPAGGLRGSTRTGVAPAWTRSDADYTQALASDDDDQQIAVRVVGGMWQYLQTTYLVQREEQLAEQAEIMRQRRIATETLLGESSAALVTSERKWSNRVPAWMAVAGVGTAIVGAAVWRNHRRAAIRKQSDVELRRRTISAYTNQDTEETGRLVRRFGIVVDEQTRRRRSPNVKYTLAMHDSEDGDTPLIHAARKGKYEVLTELLTKTCIDVTQTNFKGQNALHQRFLEATTLKDMLFLDNTPCKDLIHQCDNEGNTPLMSWSERLSVLSRTEQLAALVQHIIVAFIRDETHGGLPTLVGLPPETGDVQSTTKKERVEGAEAWFVQYPTRQEWETQWSSEEDGLYILKSADKYLKDEVGATEDHYLDDDIQKYCQNWTGGDQILGLKEVLEAAPFMTEEQMGRMSSNLEKIPSKVPVDLCKAYMTLVRGLYSVLNRNASGRMQTVSSEDFRTAHTQLLAADVHVTSIWMPDDAAYPYLGTSYVDASVDVPYNKTRQRLMRGRTAQTYVHGPVRRKVPLLAFYWMREEVLPPFTKKQTASNRLMEGMADEGYLTPLMFAALCTPAVFKKCLETLTTAADLWPEQSYKQRKVAERDARDNTLLHYVMMGGFAETLQQMCDHFPEAVAKQSVLANVSGETPASVALRTEHCLASLLDGRDDERGDMRMRINVVQEEVAAKRELEKAQKDLAQANTPDEKAVVAATLAGFDATQRRRVVDGGLEPRRRPYARGKTFTVGPTVVVVSSEECVVGGVAGYYCAVGDAPRHAVAVA